MIRYLAVLQLPFLFVTGVVVASEVLWLREGMIWAYLGMLALLAASHRPLLRLNRRLSSPWMVASILLAGALLAALIYRPMHLGTWEEGSAVQALKLGALGLVSLLASQRAARDGGGGGAPLAAALAVTGAVWIPVLVYPTFAILAVGLTLAVALYPLASAPAEASARPRVGEGRPFGSLARYLIFLCALDFGWTVAEYVEEMDWAALFALAFAAAAVGAVLEKRFPGRALVGALTLECALFLATVLWPDLVLQPGRMAGVGLALGVAMAALARTAGAAALVGSSFGWGLGLLLASGLGQNLPHAGWRALLVVPAAWLAWRVGRWKREGGRPVPGVPA